MSSCRATNAKGFAAERDQLRAQLEAAKAELENANGEIADWWAWLVHIANGDEPYDVAKLRADLADTSMVRHAEEHLFQRITPKDAATIHSLWALGCAPEEIVQQVTGHPPTVANKIIRRAAPAPSVCVVRDPSSAQLDRFFKADEGESLLAIGDSQKLLAKMPSGVFQTCVTSPPYWSLRNYHIKGQIGLEASLNDYLKSLVAVFREVHRTLRDDGTLWLNIGDSYTSGGRTWRAPDKKNPVRAMNIRPPTPDGLKPKDLIGVPWRLAFALQSAGWYLRTDLIWNKPNCQPESVKDRPTRSHEYVFLFSKQERYYYDPSAVRGPNDRNIRSVLDINTRPFPEAHFATFPPALVDPCIRLASRTGSLVLDPFLGAGTTGLVALALQRRFVGVELNPNYVEIAERRLNGAVIK